MRIPFTEPVSPHYIHINPATNKVHLMVPVVGGQEISTDNTCKATTALKEFFDGGALRELNAYKEALAFDIELLEAGHAERVAKEARLAQIEAYIEAVSAMRHSYSGAMTAFLGRPSNLYSIQLRPRVQDILSQVVNPIFNVNRTNDTNGTPKSALYNAMHGTFPTASIAYNPRAALTMAVLTALSTEKYGLVRFSVHPELMTKEDLQKLLGAKCAYAVWNDAVYSIDERMNWEALPIKSGDKDVLKTLFPKTTGEVCVASEVQLTQLKALTGHVPVTHIQDLLSAQFKRLFEVDVDFHQAAFKDNPPSTKITLHPLNKAFIDEKMGYGDDATPEDYIDALLGYCAETMWPFINISPFYKAQKELNTEGLTTAQIQEIQAEANATKAEQLSLTTQFFLGVLNVYCKAKGINSKNFGIILDASSVLSGELISVVSMTLASGGEIEKAICDFCNAKADQFEFSRLLSEEDVTAIRQTFERTYRTVTATKENPHMDDFMILDKDAAGETAKFVTHQGAICVNFAEIVDATAASANPEYFEGIRTDFAIHPTEIPQSNTLVTGEVELDVETLLTSMNDEQFERLPQAVRDACRAHPSFQARHFLSSVAKATPDKADPTHIKTEAEALLTATPEYTQTLLRTPGVFTDYSGRTFNCTAYEYAYWAKDTHMCHMLEHHMDDETKAAMAARIDEMKRIDAATGQPVGLVYSQAGQEHRCIHFDFTPLKEAYQRYLDGYDAWHAASNWAAMDAAWWDVGKAQRNVPAHVAQEYCRPDRTFEQRPEFNDATLPRLLTFYNWTTSRDESWFPLQASNSGLGFNFALIRTCGCPGSIALPSPGLLPKARRPSVDLAAITHLDEMRIVDLTQTREHLNPPEMAQSMSV